MKGTDKGIDSPEQDSGVDLKVAIYWKSFQIPILAFLFPQTFRIWTSMPLNC